MEDPHRMAEDQNKDHYGSKRDYIGLKFAVRGLGHFFRTQRNARIHAVIAALVVTGGFFFGISSIEWLVVILCIGFVLSAEMFNTAIERLTDIISPGFNEKAGVVKDIAAGAVLVAAIVSVIAGFWIFGPRILELIATWSVP